MKSNINTVSDKHLQLKNTQKHPIFNQIILKPKK